jgi:hypothetical protein
MRATLIVPGAVFVFLLSTNPRVCFPSLLLSMVHVLAKVSSVCAVSMSSQSFDLVHEYDSVVIGRNFSEVRGIESEDAFFESEPAGTLTTTMNLAKYVPCDSSKERESLTTEVHLKLRSLEAVKSCLPSSP